MANIEHKSVEQVTEYKAVDSSFVDYTRFEGDATLRGAQKKAFINGEEYSPVYDYKKLDSLIDDETLTAKKTAIYESVLELDVAKEAPDANAAELELYRQFHELRLKRIMLVEAARDLHIAGTSSAMETARESFMEMNEIVYGEFDTPTFDAMLSTEIDQLETFEPKNVEASTIQRELADILRYSDTRGEKEKPLLTIEELGAIKSVIIERYDALLSAIPDTDDSVYYNAEESAEIMNKAIEATGLAESGWKVIVNPAKSNPSTIASKRVINLPSNTHRNAQELRRLSLHEMEVHARRGENGRIAEFGPLKEGTAEYADAEEGLGVLLESALEGNFDNPSFYRARDRYITAGLALGVDGGCPRDAHQVFDIVWRTMAIRNSKDGEIDQTLIDTSKDKAYVLVENAFRGTPFWRQGTIYTKLKVYYEGLQKNADFFRENMDDLNSAFEKAMIGKYNHTDPEEYSLIVNSLNTTAEI